MDNEENMLSDLETTKRDHKVEITDIAISKVPYVKYREIPEDQYETLQSLVKGDEYSVEPMSDTETNHVIVSEKGCVVVILHNHPNLSKISLEDVMFMLRLSTVKMVVAVTNRGAIGYIVKTGDYEKNKLAAYKLMEEAVERNNRANNLKQKQDACDYFLNNCYKVGLIYED